MPGAQLVYGPVPSAVQDVGDLEDHGVLQEIRNAAPVHIEQEPAAGVGEGTVMEPRQEGHPFQLGAVESRQVGVLYDRVGEHVVPLVVDERADVVQAGGVEQQLPEMLGLLHNARGGELAADHVGVPDDGLLVAGVVFAF